MRGQILCLNFLNFANLALYCISASLLDPLKCLKHVKHHLCTDFHEADLKEYFPTKM